MNLCFATNNTGKLNEIRNLLKGGFTIKSLKEIGFTGELPEEYDTLEGNSQQKAVFIWNKFKIPCFSDDTGLEVRALNGAPGVYSAMYAGKECNADKNISLLLERMKGIEDRKARFRTVISLIIKGELIQVEGIVNGYITESRVGFEGFGYDPVFVPDGYKKTFAEFSMDEKNKISHRGKAVYKLIELLLKDATR